MATSSVTESLLCFELNQELITPGSALGTIYVAENQTQASHIQDKCYTLCYYLSGPRNIDF